MVVSSIFFYFQPLLGEMIVQFDSYFSDGLKPPTSKEWPWILREAYKMTGVSSGWLAKRHPPPENKAENGKSPHVAGIYMRKHGDCPLLALLVYQKVKDY